MKFDTLLNELFPNGFQIEKEGSIVSGSAICGNQRLALIGTVDHTLIGIDEIIRLSRIFLKIIKEQPGIPILMLVDNNGQRMALREELLGLPEYIGHLAAVQDYARRNGHKVISLIYGNAVAGGFIAFGMGAQTRIYAVDGASPYVMNLPAISRVTKLPLEKLENLSRTIPVFAPGCNNFYKMGGLTDIWHGNLAACLETALKEYSSIDSRAELGRQRGGRREAINTINAIINA
ncbi:biotin-independent malonate decarboxylase subunit gamma [Lentisphaerota bacterium ZTH]|nr:biotin-independent malonate decarboxylase subunit gamma [Lentisphaerota bacterium]WET05376.1 biotin-independent malonate decarboxylase subunit gamma [Lentisphaerota bacterium ZTH]